MSEVAGDPSPGERPRRHEEKGGTAEHLREDAGLARRDRQEDEDDRDLIEKAKDKLKGQ